MAITLADPPFADALVERGGVMSWQWAQWLVAFIQRLTQTTQVLLRKTLDLQQAAIGTTPLATGALSSGLYRITWYARITQAATVNSSLIVTIGWTDGTVSCQKAFPALTGNTTNTADSGTVMVRGDQAIALTYATAYVSVGATPMQYSLDVILEAL